MSDEKGGRATSHTRRSFCPDCGARGTLEGAGGATWMRDANGHEWGYRE